MKTIPTQTDGQTSLAGADFNQIPDELETIITSSGQTLDGNTTNQASRAISNIAMNATFYTDSGSANNITLTNTNNPVITSLRDGMQIIFKAAATNTGATTLDLASLGAKSVVDFYGVALAGGYIQSGVIYSGLYDSTADNFKVSKYKAPYFYDNSTAQKLFFNSDNTIGVNTSLNPSSISDKGYINLLAESTFLDCVNIKSLREGGTIFTIWQTGTSTFNAINFYKGDVQTIVGSISCTTTNTAYNTTSDYRLKENAIDYKNGLECINKIKVKEYNFKIEKNKKFVGSFAHELQEVIPNAVTGEKDAVDDNGNIKAQGVDFSALVPYLIQAVQDLSKQVDYLKSQLENL